MFGCNTRGWHRSGFRVDIECPGPDVLTEVEPLLDPASGELRLFQSLEEAVLAAQERLAELEEKGRQCVAHIAYYESTMKPVLLVVDPDGHYKLPAQPCIEHATLDAGVRSRE